MARVRSEHFNQIITLPAFQAELHGQPTPSREVLDPLSGDPLTRSLGEWILQAIDFTRETREHGEDAWAMRLLSTPQQGSGKMRREVQSSGLWGAAHPPNPVLCHRRLLCARRQSALWSRQGLFACDLEPHARQKRVTLMQARRLIKGP